MHTGCLPTPTVLSAINMVVCIILIMWEDLVVQLIILLVRVSPLPMSIAIIAKVIRFLTTMVLLPKLIATIAKEMLPNQPIFLHMGTISHRKICFHPKECLWGVPKWVLPTLC